MSNAVPIGRTLAIAKVRNSVDAAAVTALVWEFFAYLRRDFPDRAAMISQYLEIQDVAGELGDLLKRFTPPRGECLLAKADGEPVGTLMLKRHDAQTCEMNRMWVHPEARGLGLGRRLIEELCDAARDMGFARMVLEALDERIPAVPLYRRLGFVTNPDRTLYAQSDPRVISLYKIL